MNTGKRVMDGPLRDFRLIQFNLRIAVLEPYSDVDLELRGAKRGVNFRPLEEEVLAAVERVVEERAGSMKGVAQVEVRDISTKSVGGLIRD